MTHKQLFRSNTSKIIALLLLYLVIIFIGGILFTCGLGFRKRTMLLRMSYMIIAVIWVVACIWGISAKIGFRKYWRGMMSDIFDHEEDAEKKTHMRYQELMDKYPLSIAEYESHRWKENPRPETIDIMEDALHIERKEWEEKEKSAKLRLEERQREHRKKADISQSE